MGTNARAEDWGAPIFRSPKALVACLLPMLFLYSKTERGPIGMAKGKKGANSMYDKMKIADRLPEIEGYARDGYRVEDICKVLGISRQTFHNWANKYEDFAEAVRRGKDVVDAEVENELLNNAMGRIFWEETQELGLVFNPDTGRKEEKLITTKRVRKYIKPDTTAQIFWLKNRRPEVWRDKQHVEHEGEIGVKGLEYLTDEELEKELKRLEADE